MKTPKEHARAVYQRALYSAAYWRADVSIWAHDTLGRIWTSHDPAARPARSGWRLVCDVRPDPLEHGRAVVTRPGKSWGVSQHRVRVGETVI